MRLTKRLADLEARLDPPALPSWVRILQYEGQTQEQAIALHEAEHGPIGEKNIVLRVIISKPFPAPAYA